MTRPPWVGHAAATLVAAAVANVILTAIGVAHDTALVTLLTAAVVAVGALLLRLVETAPSPSWTVVRQDAAPDPGEDTRTAMFRHLIEVHETSRNHNDTILWQLRDLADRRVRQVHGFRPADDPARAADLVGPLLADLLSRDPRRRYRPDHHYPRYTPAQLGDAVRRIEEL